MQDPMFNPAHFLATLLKGSSAWTETSDGKPSVSASSAGGAC